MTYPKRCLFLLFLLVKRAVVAFVPLAATRIGYQKMSSDTFDRRIHRDNHNHVTTSQSTFAVLSHSTSTRSRTTRTRTRTRTTTNTIVLSSLDSVVESNLTLLPDVTPILTAVIALVLLIAAQSFINQLLDGDQGLGAFLKDGSGYNKSGFRTVQQNQKRQQEQSKKDPLPWLKLPQLDFVDVTGQEKPTPTRKSIAIVEEVKAGDVKDSVYQELELFRLQMNRELQEENWEEASRIRTKLERLMRENSIEYTTTKEEEKDAFQ
ncbi:hypothetical protein IV203_013807 [Nitzschia inconspicua]|uniref:UVR domain-containing protein n=1 Tax=Nitzschia inconspicua TaxID=303405 RepID=A0A9K3Q7Q5_9STRA|nr:hypothetical protein IV203_013807 [Nitzschia inconspicua]